MTLALLFLRRSQRYFSFYSFIPHKGNSWLRSSFWFGKSENLLLKLIVCAWLQESQQGKGQGTKLSLLLSSNYVACGKCASIGSLTIKPHNWCVFWIPLKWGHSIQTHGPRKQCVTNADFREHCLQATGGDALGREGWITGQVTWQLHHCLDINCLIFSTCNSWCIQKAVYWEVWVLMSLVIVMGLASTWDIRD